MTFKVYRFMMEKCVQQGTSRRRVTVQIIADTVIWLTIAIPVLYIFVAGQPSRRGFFCDDETLNYPYISDTISTTDLVIGGFGIFFFTLVAVEILNCADRRCRRTCNSLDDFIYCAKGFAVFLVGFVVQQLVVETTKKSMGFLRPNFFAVCQPVFNQSLCGTYITEYTCSESEFGAKELREIRQSFPSGHAAFSMYIAAFLCVYIQGRLRISFSVILKPLMQFGLLFLSFICGIGRVLDNKHHPHDVVAGFLVGILIALALHKTIGQKIFVIKEKMPSPTTEREEYCCACAESAEPQTPAPLLQNDFSIDMSNGLAQKEVQFNIRRHTLPTTRVADI